MTALRIAIAGFGLAGEVFHAPLIDATQGLTVTAIATSNPVRAARARAQYPGVAVMADADALLADHFDALVVATPNRLHVPIARGALHRGLPVVVDKPLAPGAAEAQALVEDFAAAGVPLTVFHNRRWDGDFLTVRRAVESGQLGTITRFESRYERFRPEVRADAWRERPGTDGGGLLLDLGSHLVDQALTLFGPPLRVYAEIDRRRAGAQVEDDVFVALEHAGGVRSHLWMSAVAPVGGRSLRASGTRGGIETPGLDPQEEQLTAGLRPRDLGWGQGRPARLVDRAGEERSMALQPGAYERYYAALGDALRGDGEMPVDPGDGVAALRVVDAARRSAEQATVIDTAGGTT
jgi:scyllo-inositol 2-dehydrogenase (NADP+)